MSAAQLIQSHSLNSVTLTIASIQKSDAGEYECVATNDMEPAITKRIKVTVYGISDLSFAHLFSEDCLQMMRGKRAAATDSQFPES